MHTHTFLLNVAGHTFVEMYMLFFNQNNFRGNIGGTQVSDAPHPNADDLVPKDFVLQPVGSLIDGRTRICHYSEQSSER